MTSPMRIAVLVSVATLFLTPSVFGQGTSQTSSTPSPADFDACNQQAKAQAGSPSASARPRTGPMITGPGTPETGSQSGAAASTPRGKDMRITGSDVPGAREAGLSGMAPAGLSDVAYQEAYRDCMQSRGF